MLTELASASVPVEAAWLDGPQGGHGQREEPSLHPASGHDELSGFLSFHLLCEQNQSA